MRQLIKHVFVFVFGLFTCAEAAIGTAAHLASQDFLAPYRTLMPGQPTNRLICPLHIQNTPNVGRGFCQFEAQDGIFGVVTILEIDGIIRRVVLTVQPETLHMGDLILCWGMPTLPEAVPFAPQSLLPTYDWNEALYALHNTGGSGTRINYFLPVDALLLERSIPACKPLPP